MRTRWELELKAALNALTGRIVTAASVNEMALYGPEDAGHFTDPNLNFIQANILEVRTAGDQAFHFSCVQDDDDWAIWPRLVSADSYLSPDPGEGTFRTRAMPEFPLGTISEVQITPAEGSNIQEIRFTIDQREVFLRAGEVYENHDGTLTVRDRDESVLVFLDSEIYSLLTFNEPVFRPSPLKSE